MRRGQLCSVWPVFARLPLACGAAGQAFLSTAPALVALVLWALVGTGCGTIDDPACTRNLDCPGGSCVAGRCVPSDAGTEDGDDVDGLDDTADVADDADTAGGDVPDAGDVDPDIVPTGPNACGGQGALEGVPPGAAPGSPCGRGETGRWVCNGLMTLFCSGEEPRNACGGLGPLPGQPGGVCGCGGRWACDDAGELQCAGAALPNPCGGCGPLRAEPGFACEAISEENDGGVVLGGWACIGTDDVECSVRSNACGGGNSLPTRPGAPCTSPCGVEGIEICDGEDALRCVTLRPCNACGGSEPLVAEVGTACGLLGGTWGCQAGRAVCEGEVALNACGGAADADAEPPGTPCGEGRELRCDGTELVCTVAVLPPVGNVCGGSRALDEGTPGASCGGCDRGQFRCVGLDRLICSAPDTGGENACGGCAELLGEPGVACGPCGDGQLACFSNLEAVGCLGASAARNACGSCGGLDGEPGDACGPCETWVCEGGRVVCRTDEGLDTCESPEDACALLGCVELGRQCGEGSGDDARCGPCRPEFEEVNGRCEAAADAPQDVRASRGTSETWIDVAWTDVDADGYIVRRNGIDATPILPRGTTSWRDLEAPPPPLLPVPPRLAATTAEPEAVTVSWEEPAAERGETVIYTVVGWVRGEPTASSLPASGWRAPAVARSYEVQVGTLETVTIDGQRYQDEAAPSGRLEAGDASASTDRTDGIFLETRPAVVEPAAERTYTVRAVDTLGRLGASGSVNGRRAVGVVSYQWQARGLISGGGFGDLAGAASRTHLDRTAVVGTSRTYRVVVSAPGAAPATSVEVQGRRMAL